MKKLVSILLATALITAGCSTSVENVEPEPAAIPDVITMETILQEETILETEIETVLETDEIPDSEAVFYVPKEESKSAEKSPEIEESGTLEEDMEFPNTEESCADIDNESEYDCEFCEAFDGDGYCIKCGLPGPDVPEETYCSHRQVERTILEDGSIDYICADCGMDGMYFFFDGVDEEYEKQAGILLEEGVAEEEVIGE